MNNKMTTNSQLSTTEPKKYKNKINQNRNRITEIEITWSAISGEGVGENGEKGTGNKKHKQQVQNRQVEVKNSMGDGEAKELICATHGHELRWGNDGGWVGAGWRRVKRRKKMRQL